MAAYCKRPCPKSTHSNDNVEAPNQPTQTHTDTSVEVWLPSRLFVFVTLLTDHESFFFIILTTDRRRRSNTSYLFNRTKKRARKHPWIRTDPKWTHRDRKCFSCLRAFSDQENTKYRTRTPTTFVLEQHRSKIGFQVKKKKRTTASPDGLVIFSSELCTSTNSLNRKINSCKHINITETCFTSTYIRFHLR